MSAKKKIPAAVKKAAAHAAAKPPAPATPRTVVLRTKTAQLPVTPAGMEHLRSIAMRWSHTVAAREQWKSSPRDKQSVIAEAGADLEKLLELPLPRIVAALTSTDMLEVSMPWGGGEEEHWPSRIMPWEFLVTAATDEARRGARLIVLRHLDCGRPPAVPRTDCAAWSGLISCSVPPAIGPDLMRSLTEESRVTKSIWEQHGVTVDELMNPARPTLTASLKKGADWLHFLAVNTSDLKPKEYDAVLLSGGGPEEESVSLRPEALRSAIAKSVRAPQVAVFSFCSSAARLAASAVAGGAGAAIGFQDFVADQTCMDVVTLFYPALRRNGGDVLQAFRELWDRMETSLSGTGIVLWSGRSLLAAGAEKEAAERAAAVKQAVENLAAAKDAAEKEAAARPVVPPRDAIAAAAAPPGPPAPLPPGAPELLPPPVLPAPPAPAAVPVVVPPPVVAETYGLPDFLEVKLKLVQAANFSLLHNGRSLFQQFEIGRPDDKPMRDVLIEVSVNDGGQNSTWRTLRTFKRGGVDIAKDVQLAFLSGMVRSLRESIATTIQISISCGGRLLWSESRLVKLLAIDEWVDDDDNRCWLPSFVQPRDAAVADVITRAEGYLQALCDDFGAGFDGYQSEPEQVDLQVRALWVALSRDCRIRYINPPPTYTHASQRLRRPGEIISTRQGTCLDLALLMGACMEWVGLYPVIFLISGHAFPGFWRSEQAYADFYDPKNLPPVQAVTPGGDQRPQPVESKVTRPWVTGRERAAAILREVQCGRLVPLESVWLTDGRSLAEAMEAGRNNLFEPQAFEFLIDVQRAREQEQPVTPLPLPEKS